MNARMMKSWPALKNQSHRHDFTLILSGAGTNGPLEVGAVYALYEEKLFPSYFVGTSAGSITAAMLSIGKQPSNLKDIVFDADFRMLIDYQWLSVIGRWTLASNRNVLAWLREITENKMMVDTHFPLTTVSGNLTTQKPFYWRSREFPTMPIHKAVYASMAIPFIFKPYLGEYVDGGTMDNLPVNEVPRHGKAIAFLVTESGGVGPITGPIDEAGRILSMLLEANEYQAKALAASRKIPVVVLRAGHRGFLDRDMSLSEKSELWYHGYRAVKDWLKSEEGLRWKTM